MRAGGEEFAQPFRGKRDRIRPRHADDVETLRRARPRASAALSAAGVRNRDWRSLATAAGRAAFRPSSVRNDGRDLILAYQFLGGLVFVPRHIAQIIDGGQMRRRGQIGIGQAVAGEPVAGADQPADIGQMVPDVGLCSTQRFGVGRAAAVAGRDVALIDPLHHQRRRETSAKNFSLNQLIRRRTSTRPPTSCGNSR